MPKLQVTFGIVVQSTTCKCLFTGTLPVKGEHVVPTVKPENKIIGNFKELSYHRKANLLSVPTLDYSAYNQFVLGWAI